MKVVDVGYSRFWNITENLFELIQKLLVVCVSGVLDIDKSDIVLDKMFQLIGDMNDEFIHSISENV